MIASRTFHSHFANSPHLHEAHSLLTWIVTSHKGSLKHIPLAEQTQFEMNLSANGNLRLFKITNSPEKEASFLRAKGNSQTEFMFHGSNPYCWHSIIHNNLKNLSNTPQMAHGNSWGNGIYMAQFAQGALKKDCASTAVGQWNNATMGKLS